MYHWEVIRATMECAPNKMIFEKMNYEWVANIHSQRQFRYVFRNHLHVEKKTKQKAMVLKESYNGCFVVVLVVGFYLQTLPQENPPFYSPTRA